jgi:hydrogenase maturation factor
MTLPPGKIPIDILKEGVFKNLGAARKDVILGPTAGVDCAVLDAGNKSVVVSMDPITGAQERIGWLAVNVNANDIATFGVEPAFLFSCLMLPEGSNRELIEKISGQMGEAAAAIGMAIVGGHAETTPGITHPIVVGCSVGITPKGQYVTAANAQPGDAIILTKSAGVEGTAILASDLETELTTVLDEKGLQAAKEVYRIISVVKDALTAYQTGGVYAMHDPTEGGIAGGIHEMADGSGLGFELYRECIRVEPETDAICKYFELDPLQLIGSGALLIAVQPEKAQEILQSLKKQQIHAAIIGKFHSEKTQRQIIVNQKAEPLPRPVSDHLWRALRRK